MKSHRNKLTLTLNADELTILTSALDSHVYWQSSKRAQALLARLERLAFVELEIIDGGVS